MCGVIGVFSEQSVIQLTYDGLSMLQHRGQDAAGIATCDNRTFHLHKDNGLLSDVFDETLIARLTGNMGIGHVRYPTAGCSSSAESQPFYVNSPYGILLAHNGNLTNAKDIQKNLYQDHLRHVNTSSDSEVMLNVFAHALAERKAIRATKDDIFYAVQRVHETCRGAYAVVALIAGVGMVAFRDPHGIRPLCYGVSETADDTGKIKTSHMVASESVAFDITGFTHQGDIAPGETLFIDKRGVVSRQSYQGDTSINPTPCLFEYVYLSRPDSVLNGVPVYQSRANMGVALAEKIKREWSTYKDDIDVIIAVPETSRTCAIEMARALDIPLREGFVKNRYVGRTFIMPNQQARSQSVRRKLNPIASEFKGKRVLLVDDSIVRGTTARQIIAMVRSVGAEKVYLSSAAPEVCYPNVYGIDMPSRGELLAGGKTAKEITDFLACDKLIYQDLDALKKCITDINSQLTDFEDSVFSGRYVTRDVDEDYLIDLEEHRQDTTASKLDKDKTTTQNMLLHVHEKL